MLLDPSPLTVASKIGTLRKADRLSLLEPDSGGVTVNRARSCASVSLIKVVMSWGRRRAFVNILGGGKL